MWPGHKGLSWGLTKAHQAPGPWLSHCHCVSRSGLGGSLRRKPSCGAFMAPLLGALVFLNNPGLDVTLPVRANLGQILQQMPTSHKFFILNRRHPRSSHGSNGSRLLRDGTQAAQWPGCDWYSRQAPGVREGGSLHPWQLAEFARTPEAAGHRGRRLPAQPQGPPP